MFTIGQIVEWNDGTQTVVATIIEKYDGIAVARIQFKRGKNKRKQTKLVPYFQLSPIHD